MQVNKSLKKIYKECLFKNHIHKDIFIVMSYFHYNYLWYLNQVWFWQTLNREHTYIYIYIYIYIRVCVFLNTESKAMRNKTLKYKDSSNRLTFEMSFNIPPPLFANQTAIYSQILTSCKHLQWLQFHEI